MADPIEVRMIAKKDCLKQEVKGFECSKLKHVTCDDRSAPIIEKVKTNRSYVRTKLCDSIKGGQPLRHVGASQISDRSAPLIDKSITIKHVQRSKFLDNVLERVQSLYTNLISGASAKISQIQQQFSSSQKEARTISPEQKESINQLLCDINDNRNKLKRIDPQFIQNRSSPSISIRNFKCDPIAEPETPALPKDEVDFHKHDRKQKPRQSAAKEINSEIPAKTGIEAKNLDARLA